RSARFGGVIHPYAALLRDRHRPRRGLLLLSRDPRFGGAPELRCEAAGDRRSSRVRARIPRAYEHARVDADLPAAALALRDLLERRFGRAAGARLDRRSRPLLHW